MTPTEADEILELFSAAWPREDWPDDRVRLWHDELTEVGAGEGLATARAVIRSTEFLSFRAFFAALATVRERHADESPRPAFERPALPPGPAGDRSSPEVARYWLAKMRADLAAARGPLARPLSRVLEVDRHRPPRSQWRVDETYFNPPERPRQTGDDLASNASTDRHDPDAHSQRPTE